MEKNLALIKFTPQINLEVFGALCMSNDGGVGRGFSRIGSVLKGTRVSIPGGR